MISDDFGAVCLLENATLTGMDTYRLSIEEWKAIAHERRRPTQSDGINLIKNTSGALQDVVYDGAVEWMNSYFCTKTG